MWPHARATGMWKGFSQGGGNRTPSGISDRIFSSYLESMAAVMSDAMKPGATALHVMPRPANSRATVLVSPITPACELRQ